MSLITELTTQFADVRRRHEEQSAVLKELSEEWETIETQLLEAMVEEGVNSIKTDIGSFTMATTNYLSVPAGSKETFYPYLKESGNGALLKEEVNPRTLTAFLKGHLEELISRGERGGLDTVDARTEALKFLNEKGASYFTKREIRMTKK